MNDKEQEIYNKHLRRSQMQHLAYQDEGKREAYAVGYQHAVDYLNEIFESRRLSHFQNMSDDEFNEFMRSQLE